MTVKLAGAVALVTGANTGIGAATARKLGALGAAVLVVYYDDRPRAEAVVAEIIDAGGRAASFQADLGAVETIPAMFNRAEAAFGPVEILVNNAAHSERDSLATLTAAGLDRHYAVNTRAMVLACQEFARRYPAGQRGGRIINLSSGVVEGAPEELAYSASKGAIEVLTRGLAKTLGPRGITVNAVSPGPTDTGWMTPALRQALAARTPLGRIGQADDVADVIVLLASARAGWLTGQVLDAGGGWHMRF